MSRKVTKETLDAEVAGQTVTSVFLRTVREQPEAVALRWKDGEGWGELTWGDYADRAARLAAAFTAMGLASGERVVLMMRNRPEFHLVDMAVLLAGGTPISIYNSSSAEQVAYLAGHSQAKVAVVEDAAFLARVTEARGSLPHLEHLVLIEGEATDGVRSYGEMLDHEPVDLEEASGRCRPEQLATVIYTSGTTGPPKGVQITHYNVIWTVRSYLELLGEEVTGLRTISYLPMAHIAERLSSHYLGIASGFEVTTCPDPSQVAAYARDVRPETIFGVPRVWEKMYSGVLNAVGADPEKATQFDDALRASLPLQMARRERALTAEEQQTLDFLDEVAFKPVRELLGLDAARYAVSGAAPIPPETIEFFLAIGVPFSEIYGMSENTGPLTWEPWAVRPGTVGKAMPGVTVTLADDGEIIAKGGNIFPGYLDDPEKTAEALDADGWLHTGDIGEIDDDGYVRIVDRKKELIITAGGKNISPANLEASLKMIPLIGQACAIGDQRPFVSALLVLDPDAAKAWAASHGKTEASLDELADDPELQAEVAAGLDDVMSEFNKAERVKKFTILSEEWLPDSEELTPTAKLKRRGVHAKYADEIEALYS